ncbi:MAG: phospho-sugar mutase [Clostridiaceae bacterium]|jgi:phosphoglucomutase|nr:phospho-sugar mutase [Clostridiaceae bacterium]
MSYSDTYRQWIASAELSAEDRAALAKIKGDDDKIKALFGAELEFGTAGMRGVLELGTNRMNIFTVKRATKGFADYVNSTGKDFAARGVVISYDTRHKSVDFAIAAARVLSANGVRVFLMEDVRPVPVCSFAIRHLNAAGGIMITASHNPKQYNGYKVYGDDGAQLSPEATETVVDFIGKSGYFGVAEADTALTPASIKGKDGFKADKYITVVGAVIDEAYFKAIEKLALSPDAVKKVGKTLKLVYTPLHGSGYKPVTTILRRMGISVTVVPEQAEPNPDFPTVPVPNPEDPAALKMAVALAKQIGADAVIGTDPDSDRMGVAVRNRDGEFVLLNGNQTGSLLCSYILDRKSKNGTLNANFAIVKTIVTTNLAADIAADYGAASFDVLTGFKFIGEKIKEWETSKEFSFLFGFEESYGYLAGTHARDKDAVVAAMLFAEMVCYLKTIGDTVYGYLTELYDKFGYYCEKSSAVFYDGINGMNEMRAIMDKLRETKLTVFADVPVDAVSDLDAGIKYNTDGSMEGIDLPYSNVVKFHLEGGDWVCARPSGTEPKLKLYVSAKRPSPAAASAAADTYLKAMSAICK